jgi:hypothetical protein
VPQRGMKGMQQTFHGSTNCAGIQVPFDIQAAHQIEFAIYVGVEEGIDFVAIHLINLLPIKGFQ